MWSNLNTYIMQSASNGDDHWYIFKFCHIQKPKSSPFRFQQPEGPLNSLSSYRVNVVPFLWFIQIPGVAKRGEEPTEKRE